MAGKVIKRVHCHLLNMPKLYNLVPNLEKNRMKSVRLSTKGNDNLNDTKTHTTSRRSKLHPLASEDVTFLPIDDSNVQELYKMNEELFPIKYNTAFYEYVADAPEGYCKLAYTANGDAIGAICCELEDVKILEKRRLRLCILTLGVLQEYRRSKLGTLLLESVISQARKDQLAYVYLHVQSCNTTALHFYFARGFKFVKFMHNYYPEIHPPHCFPLLDKNLFKKTLKVIGVRVEAKKIGCVVKKLHGHLLNLPRLRNVVPDPTNPDPYKNSSSKLILLNAKVTDIETLWPLNKDLVGFLKQESLSFVNHAIELDYSYYAVDQVLSELLPKGMDIPSSFETVGHIAHLNLRDNQLPYKNVIGQVILDKNAQIRTVVNKTDNIETKFRTFPMEVLAGDNDMEVEVRESKAVFKFNYAQVYWNSRLQQEHLRIIRRIKPTDVVCDMMCGIGPFAVPVAINGSKVYANDLNPRSYHYLKENIALNKVENLVTPYNLDGREFLAKLLNEKKQFTQVLMNLPAIALEFLDAFPGQFDYWEGELPYIYCYCFSNADDVQKDVKERAEKIMGGKLDLERTTFHLVRDVAPKKVMVCISFQLPEAIAFSSERQASKQDDSKRRKIEAGATA
ncbi:hypothetical protein DD238_004644 [Peronospora effusa]|uniref:tRNA (guanine(37)-N1)-methyltransferase n=1 Tax=Peronospora effusa TaxID=542832 RepID=A0A3M6VLX0_9STRA|nr:hypothetical protein DD238_004644 [Peronospora effusa]